VELGVYTFAEVTSADVSPARRLRNLMEEIELADQVGLDVFGVGEHHRPTSQSRRRPSCSLRPPNGRRTSG
jgi:alkanesulfonate monooxygenase SsuD/methylene tetrahydromethanopterin reductase-like flavin-dependent oxidoreductase (luciferase family)